MKIAHLNTYATGGAARAAYRLHKGLKCIGKESLFLVREPSSAEPTVVHFKGAADLLSRIRRELRRRRIDRELVRYRNRPRTFEVFSHDLSPYSELSAQLPDCDIINLHWIAGFVDGPSFFSKVPLLKPIVWTLHDMNAFTGGCHYNFGCERFSRACGACPQLGSANADDLTRRIWQRKKSTFDMIPRNRLHIVTPSRWLAKKASESSLTGSFNVSVIPYGVESDEFTPRDRNVARDLLGIDRNARVILFVGDDVENRRKGLGLLAKAIGQLRDRRDLFLLSIGRGAVSFDLGIPSLHFGYIDHDRILSFVYSAADLYVIPSIQDNLPNTILEAMACGVPVAGFAAGGIPELVRPGVTGLLAAVGHAEALTGAMRELLDNPETRRDMAANCRRIAVEEYGLLVQAKRYSDLYQRVSELAVCGARERPDNGALRSAKVDRQAGYAES